MRKIYEAKEPKKFTLIQHRRGREREIGPYTLEELIKYFSYTLEKGNSWDRKVNRNPKNINSLINNLDKAEDAATGNGYSGVSYTLKTDEPKQTIPTTESKFRKLIQSEIKKVLNESKWTRYAATDEQEEAISVIEKWLKKLNMNIVGVTTIGKSPQTVILDLTYQGSEIYIPSDGFNSGEYSVEVNRQELRDDSNISGFDAFKDAIGNK